MERKNIIIKLDTEINDQGEQEILSEEHSGEYYEKDHKKVILFMDRENQFGPVKNFITIQQDKVTIKRSGAISMQQKFLLGHKTESVYQHPYGRFLMEIKTNSVEVMAAENTLGRVIVKYDMIFQEANRQYVLTMDLLEVK